MRRSKALALVFLIGTLVVGGAAGFTVDRVLVRGYCANTSDRKTARTYLAEQLGLTAEQRAAVDTILDKRHRDMSAVVAPVRPRLDSIRDAARSEILKVLDSTQRPRFQQIIEASKRHEEANKK